MPILPKQRDIFPGDLLEEATGEEAGAAGRWLAFYALARREIEWESKFFAGLEHAGKVGAYEGAGYETRGLYRAEPDCIMFSRNPVGFCRVCRRAIERVIDLVAKP